MFLQVSVCPQGGGIPACLAGGIPACLAAGLQGEVSGLGVSGLGGVCSLGVSAPGGGLVSQHAPPGKTATAADSTHPTGMHSCLFCNAKVNILKTYS